MDLFQETPSSSNQVNEPNSGGINEPLATRMRPQSLEEFAPVTKECMKSSIPQESSIIASLAPPPPPTRTVTVLYWKGKSVITCNLKTTFQNTFTCVKPISTVPFSIVSVVLLRACWMQATDKCLVDGEATVCTCNEDLCNSARPSSWSSHFGVICFTAAVFIMSRRYFLPPDQVWIDVDGIEENCRRPFSPLFLAVLLFPALALIRPKAGTDFPDRWKEEGRFDPFIRFTTRTNQTNFTIAPCGTTKATCINQCIFTGQCSLFRITLSPYS